MGRLRELSFAFALTLPLTACSLINAPDEIRSGTGGTGGAGGTGGNGGTTTSSQACATPADCDDPGACKVVDCVAGECRVDQAKNNTPCDDGVFCTVNDLCVGGECTAGTERECTAPDECHLSTCSEADKECVVTEKPDGALCDDGDLCTSTSTCLTGVCVGGGGCQSDECNTSTCDPAVGCVTVPNAAGTPCGNTFCSTGQCDGTGKCGLVALNVGAPCDDGLFCTANEVCTEFGFCLGNQSPCSDPTPCIKAVCNEDQDKCDFNSIGAGEPCEDGDLCTGGETCNAAAQCTGGVQPTVAFFETFANLNGAGWDLGPEWQIGAAMVSSGGNVCCDPAMDFDGDGNIAGVAIGGNAVVADPPMHPFYYLTSPVVDTSTVPGPLFLTYYRWLLTDYHPFMHNVVEVSMDDGASWFGVWSWDIQTTIQDTAWTYIAHDITPYKSPTMRFRFGFDIAQAGVYQAGSWNLDHIKLQNTSCPQ